MKRLIYLLLLLLLSFLIAAPNLDKLIPRNFQIAHIESEFNMDTNRSAEWQGGTFSTKMNLLDMHEKDLKEVHKTTFIASLPAQTVPESAKKRISPIAIENLNNTIKIGKSFKS